MGGCCVEGQDETHPCGPDTIEGSEVTEGTEVAGRKKKERRVNRGRCHRRDRGRCHRRDRGRLCGRYDDGLLKCVQKGRLVGVPVVGEAEV